MIHAILSQLPPDFPWRDQIRYFPSISSTNDRLKQLAKEGAPHGTVLVAGCQTNGHGRMGRSFHSPEGKGIYLSVLLRPNCPAAELMHLTCAAAVAMCDAVEKVAGFRPGIKWTNDLVCGKHKLGGILTELGLGHNAAADWAIIGIGINCGQVSHDFPEDIRDIAGSLRMITGRDISVSALAAAMVEALEQMDHSLLTGKEAMLDAYRRDCVTLGRDISLVQGDSVRHGKAICVDDQGALVVALPDGTLETVSSGEVSIRGMYGYV